MEISHDAITFPTCFPRTPAYELRERFWLSSLPPFHALCFWRSSPPSKDVIRGPLSLERGRRCCHRREGKSSTWGPEHSTWEIVWGLGGRTTRWPGFDEMICIHSSEAAHRVRVSLGSLGNQCGPWRPSRDLAETDLAQLASIPPLEAARTARKLPVLERIHIP